MVNEPGAWAWSQLNTNNPEGSRTFYGAVFGWETDTFDSGGDETITVWRVPGYLGGWPGQPLPRDVVAGMAPITDGDFPDALSHWSIEFWVHGVDEAAERTKELGGTVITQPFANSFGRTAVLGDPQGAVFSVSEGSPKRRKGVTVSWPAP